MSVPPGVIFSYLCLPTYLITSLADFSSSVRSSRCDIFYLCPPHIFTGRPQQQRLFLQVWYFLTSVRRLTSYLHWQTLQHLFLQMWYFLISVCQLTSYLHWQTSVAVSIPLGVIFSYLCQPLYLYMYLHWQTLVAVFVPPGVIFSYLCLQTYLISSLADLSSSVCSSRCDIFFSLSANFLLHSRSLFNILAL